MRALEHMKQVLEDTGLYTMTGSSPAEWELAAFGAGFALLEERFDRVLGDLFVDTASEEMLARWEKLFRPQPSTGGLEDSRDTVRQRFAVHPDGFTPQAVKNMLPGAGVRGLLLEKGTSLVVVLGRLLGVNKEEANQELSQLLPSHLPWEWDESITWVALDAYSGSFRQWDEAGFAWSQFDQLTRDNLENSFKEQEE